MDAFWSEIDKQLTELKQAKTAQDVVRILSQERNPSGDGPTGGDGFFAGSGGDGTVLQALYEAGWHVIWIEANYHYAMRAPDGSAITYVEGDIYARDRREKPKAKPTGTFTWSKEDDEGVSRLVLETDERVTDWKCVRVPGYRTSSGATEFVLCDVRITTKDNT